MNSSFDITKKLVNLKTAIEAMQNETQRLKRFLNEQIFSELWNNLKHLVYTKLEYRREEEKLTQRNNAQKFSKPDENCKHTDPRISTNPKYKKQFRTKIQHNQPS